MVYYAGVEYFEKYDASKIMNLPNTDINFVFLVLSKKNFCKFEAISKKDTRQ